MLALEAMRFSKLLIVTSAIVSAEELVTEGNNGFIVDPHDVAPVSSLTTLAADTELHGTMGQRARFNRMHTHRKSWCLSQRIRTVLSWPSITRLRERLSCRFERGPNRL